jgi:hypothetical protein
VVSLGLVEGIAKNVDHPMEGEDLEEFLQNRKEKKNKQH